MITLELVNLQSSQKMKIIICSQNSVKPIFHCDAKFWRRGLALGNSPDARLLRWGYQHVGISRRQTPEAKPKICVSPNAKPDASQWNIGCVGSLALGLCVGHVHFIFFVLISFALGSQRKPSFQWNMGFTKQNNNNNILE